MTSTNNKFFKAETFIYTCMMHMDILEQNTWYSENIIKIKLIYSYNQKLTLFNEYVKQCMVRKTRIEIMIFKR
jgi:hypothetical protein